MTAAILVLVGALALGARREWQRSETRAGGAALLAVAVPSLGLLAMAAAGAGAWSAVAVAGGGIVALGAALVPARRPARPVLVTTPLRDLREIADAREERRAA